MRTLGRTAALVALLASSSATAHADVTPGERDAGDTSSKGASADPAHLRAAAEAFDTGGAAFKRKDFEAAASSFEAAYVAVPGAKALRLAIRSHSEAGHGARAATLAALAQARYPGDDVTQKLAAETIEQLEPLLQRVQVNCSPSCTVTFGAPEPVLGEPSARWTVYVDPGKPALRATFVDGRGEATKEVNAVAGRTTSVTLEAKAKRVPAVVEPAPVPVPVPTPAPVASPPPAPPLTASDPPPAPPRSRGIPRGVFIGGVVVTAVLGGVTIWSGVDTVSHPGADAVRVACAGKGETCPEYEAGRAHQLRTNVLLGATVGVAVVTGVLGIFTKWKGNAAAAPASAFQILPTAAALDRGAALGAVGRF